jgi:nicotinamidase-related amidase
MNQRKKNALLIIDAQYDFCNPNGSLFVPGAEEDNKRLSNFILNNVDEIDYMATTLDSHHLNDIAHPSFWKDKNGKNPNPFSVISAKDVRDGNWTPRFYSPQRVLQYLDALESQGEFPHVIWPAHCLIGSKGHSIDDIIFDAIKSYEYKGKTCQKVTKGTHPLTEHFGAFCAQVPIAGVPETDVRMDLLKTLAEYENIYLAGQAKSHCVATTLKQAIKFVPDLAKKFIILEDCMSSVQGGPDPSNASLTFESLAQPIYDDAKKAGVRFSTSTQEKLGQSSNAHALV